MTDDEQFSLLLTLVGANDLSPFRDEPGGINPARGLSAKTMSSIRCVDAAASNQLAAELIIAWPSASLHETADASRISPGTVREVRTRFGRGEDPVAWRYRRGAKVSQAEVRSPVNSPDRR